ncbi:MAG: hypothetical protein D6698_16325 [Gammaproteobacteria bacterium]|nr:MAG: hypothetical protein D6698_16325 [Gammaproteobacteria bacterium]
MNVYAAIKAVLSDDTTINAIATGGIHDRYSVGRNGLQRRHMADSDAAPVHPAVYLGWSNRVPFGDQQKILGADRLFVDVYFYQDSGYDIILTLRERVRTVLEYNPVAVDGAWMADIFWRGDILGQFDDGLRCCVERSTYEILLVRR